jgi:hypothetical protein
MPTDTLYSVGALCGEDESDGLFRVTKVDGELRSLVFVGQEDSGGLASISRLRPPTMVAVVAAQKRIDARFIREVLESDARRSASMEGLQDALLLASEAGNRAIREATQEDVTDGHE